MKNALNSTRWNTDDMLSNDFYAEDHEADLSAESFSWDVDPMALLQDLEEWDDDQDDNFDGMF